MQKWIAEGEQGDTVAVVAARGEDPALAEKLQKKLPRALTRGEVSKQMLHAYYWSCPKDDLRAIAELAVPSVQQYLRQILYNVPEEDWKKRLEVISAEATGKQ